MTNLIKLDSKKLPARFKSRDAAAIAAANAFFTGGISTGGLPKLSFRGKAFRLRIGEEETVLKNADGDAKGSLTVVIVSARPTLSKAWYDGEFVEGETSEPDCSSKNALTPDVGVPNKQSDDCRLCPLSGYGTPCRDSKRLIVAFYSEESGELMRDDSGEILVAAATLPATSLKNLRAYEKLLTKNNAQFNDGVTRLRMDADATWPIISMEFEGFLPEDMFEEVVARAEGQDVVEAVDVGDANPPKASPKAEKAVAKEPAAKKAAPKEETVVEQDEIEETEPETVVADEDLDGIDWD